MAKVRYYYDSASSQYKRAEETLFDKICGGIKVLTISIAISVVLVVAYSFYFDFPDEIKLRNEVAQLESHYKQLDQEVSSLHTLLASLEEKDDKVYRAVLGIKPIDKSIREGGVGGAERYRELRKGDLEHKDLIISLSDKIDKLKRSINIEITSQSELLDVADSKQRQYASIPAIQPISNKQLTALASGFGNRIHPIYKVLKMHTGIDFASPIGTPVYATANGVIELIDTLKGYGKTVIIDHGFGYKTRYAHLNDFAVKIGTRVKRGEQIGCVGNTGVSTAPHLHYEVLIDGKHANPVYYFFNDLNAEEYEKIVQLASVQNQSLGN